MSEHLQKKNHANKEVFSIKLALIIVSIHIAGLYGLYFIKLSNLIYLVCSFYFFIIIGASITLHNYISHKSFEFNFNILRILFLLTATCCLQGAPISWASQHINHHGHTDKFKDPHSRKRGFFWSHMGWLFYKNPNGYSQVSSLTLCKHLIKDPVIHFFNIHYMLINLIFLIGLYIFSMAINRIDIFFLIGPLRILCVWHATWLLNSIGHYIDKKGNLVLNENSNLIKLLIPGEQNHSLHHKSPKQLSTNYILSFLKKIKLINNQFTTSNTANSSGHTEVAQINQ